MLSPTETYIDFLRQGRFMLQRSASSGRSIFYPRVAEPGTGATDLEWVEASGLATVYSTTTQRSRPPKPDVNVALVDLDEGPRMLARIDGIAPDAVTIGMRVRAEIVTEDDMPMVVFRPLADVAKA